MHLLRERKEIRKYLDQVGCVKKKTENLMKQDGKFSSSM
ncbi:hypothetical protein PUN28_001611 [Cardiocondyla obscurior]|uniref:Uncharacterized protein n=1 Tax=Cardiocondyla obscurior TaxID=286306 RepID=A0AAW2GQD4_9HYME